MSYDISKRVNWADEEHAVEGGGQLDGVTCEIKNAKFVVQDQAFRDKYFKGKGGDFGDSVALFLEYHPVDGGDAVWKSYGLGKVDSWQVIDNGDYFAPVGESVRGVHKNSGYYKFQTALVEAGYPATRMVQGASGLNGTVVQMVAVETGKTYTDNRTGKEMKDREPLPEKVVKLPDATPPAKNEQGGVSGDEELAQVALVTLLGIAGEIEKKKLLPTINKNINELGITKAQASQFFVKYFQKDVWLKGVEGVKLEGGKVSLG